MPYCPSFCFFRCASWARGLRCWACRGNGHCSRAYLAAMTGRPPTRREVFRHFFAFEEFLLLRLRVARGQPHRGDLAPDATGFRQLLATGEPALLGTFHVGHSDLTGFLLGRQEHRRVFMVRQRVGNSHDTEILGAEFAKWVTFIWVNEAENLLFALKDAITAGGSVALKCDRLEFSSKTEAFMFLGARRLFPFTIYHLALIFGRPVVLCVGLPDGTGTLRGAQFAAVRARRGRKGGQSRSRPGPLSGVPDPAGSIVACRAGAMVQFSSAQSGRAMRAVRRIYYFLAGHLSWLVFGAVSLVLNFACAILLVLPGHQRRGPAARATIRRLFAAWCSWLHAARLIYVSWNGFTPEALAGPRSTSPTIRACWMPPLCSRDCRTPSASSSRRSSAIRR
jgi:hypothetical protein